MLYRYLIIFVLFYLNIAAAQDSLATYKLNQDIVITANRVATAFQDVARTVTVITQQEIKSIPAQSVPELLENVIGVDVQQRGTQGVQADISMRGAGFNQTLILLNGIKLSDPQTGHHNMNLPVDISDIERIEILKGPGSRLYGPNAFGGVINIITKKSDKVLLQIGGYYGEHNLNNQRLNFDLPFKNSSNRITLSKSGSDGYKYNTNFHNVNISQNSTVSADNLNFHLSSGYNEKHFGANNFYIPIFPNPFQYEETKLSYLQGGLKYRMENMFFNYQLYFRKHDDTYFWNKFESSPNIHHSKTLSTELNGQFNHNFGITTLGIEYINEALKSNSLGLESQRQVNGFYNHDRKTTGLFFQHQLHLFDFSINFGASLYHYSTEGWHGWPGADIAYRINQHLKVYASYSEGFRVPTYTNLYLNFPATATPFVRAFGNADLENEESKSYEIGYTYTADNLEFESAVFQRDDKNLIDYVFDSDQTLYMAQNFASLSTRGFDGSFRWLNPVKYINSIFAQYAYLDLDADLSGKITIYALSHFRHQAITGIALNMPYNPNITNNWKIRYEERVISSSYVTLDTRFSWQNKKMRFYLDITNILDNIYEDIQGVKMPGRWVKAGFEYDLLR